MQSSSCRPARSSKAPEMDFTRRSALSLMGAGAGAAAVPLVAGSRAGAEDPGPLAPRPPMGWNSWNSFATTITEAQSREIAAIMVEKLLPFGYDVFTIDIQWYEPEARSYTYNNDPKP